jgi:hypothetical protein
MREGGYKLNVLKDNLQIKIENSVLYMWLKLNVKTSLPLVKIAVTPATRTNTKKLQYRVDPGTSNGLMFEQLESRTKNLRKIRF